MKCLLGRILPWLVDTGILSPKQKAYIARQGMNEHVFCLKTGVDDFKHESCKLFTVFLDFRDAFGTLSHKIMLNALKEIHPPQPFADLITDVYKGSFLQVTSGHQLTEPIPLQVGIETGCPWSAMNFILAINQWLKWLVQCAPPDIRSPNPVQGYADDVEVSSRDESVIHNMQARTDEFLHWSKLEVKHTKCAALYERRSGGNRWYKAKSDKPPSFTITGQPIRVYSRHESYWFSTTITRSLPFSTPSLLLKLGLSRSPILPLGSPLNSAPSSPKDVNLSVSIIRLVSLSTMTCTKIISYSIRTLLLQPNLLTIPVSSVPTMATLRHSFHSSTKSFNPQISYPPICTLRRRVTPSFCFLIRKLKKSTSICAPLPHLPPPLNLSPTVCHLPLSISLIPLLSLISSVNQNHPHAS